MATPSSGRKTPEEGCGNQALFVAWGHPTRYPVESDLLSSILFTACFLSGRRDLSHDDFADVAVRIEPFDIHSPVQARREIDRVLRSSAVDSSPPPGRSWFTPFRRAAAEVEELIRRGVFIIRSESLRSPRAELHPISPILFALGDPSLLEKPTVAVLGSRKPRRHGPGAPWIQQTKTIALEAVQNGKTVVSSIGSAPYLLVSALSKGFPTIIVCPDRLPFMSSEAKTERFLSDYRDLFHFPRTLFVSACGPWPLSAKPARLVARDHLVAALASEVFAVDVRTGGNMEGVLAIAERRGVVMEPPAVGTRNHGKGGTTRGTPCEPVGIYDQYLDDDFLFHYTRSCPGPWPGQSIAQYWLSLADSCPESGHRAVDTLARILQEGFIRGSSRLTRGRVPVVCFTECPPDQMHEITRWRRGLIRWSFEPYAIAIRRKSLLDLGARKVTYGTDELYRSLPEIEKHFFQIHGASVIPWSMEREWRMVGDVCLGSFEQHDVLILVQNTEEAAMLSEITPYRVTYGGITRVSRRNADDPPGHKPR